MRFCVRRLLVSRRERELRSVSNIPTYFYQSTQNLYRPIRTTLHNLFFQAFEVNPWKYHALGILLHLAVGWVVFQILIRLIGSPSPLPALGGALFFALHPQQIEKVVFITSAFDIFGDLFCLLAFLRYLQGRMKESRWGFPSSAAWACLGFFTTETALIFPILVVIYELFPIWVLPKWSKPNAWIVLITVIGILAVYLAIRTAAIGRISRENLEGITFFQVQAAMGLVYLKNWIHFLFPFPHEPFLIRQEMVKSVFQPGVLAAWGTILVLLVVAIRWRPAFPYLLLGFLWFHFSYLPNSNLVFTGTLSAERYLYLPSVGWAVIIAGLISRFRFAKWMVFGIVLIFAGTTFLRVPIWKDESTILAHSLSVAPSDPYLVGKDIMKRVPERSVQPKQQMLKILLQNPVWEMKAVEEWSAVLMDEGRYSEALGVLDPYVEETNRSILLHNWALVYCSENPGEFEEELSRIRFKHRSGAVFTPLGICLAKHGQDGKAKRAFYRALVYGGKRDELIQYLQKSDKKE